MWDFRMYDAGLSILNERAVDKNAVKSEVEGVTQAIRNDKPYFNCNMTGSSINTKVAAYGIAIPDDDEPNNGYVFVREDDDELTYGVMRFESDNRGLKCTEYAENLAYSNETDLPANPTLHQKCDAYYELLRSFSDTPDEDVKQLLPSYEPAVPEISY